MRQLSRFALLVALGGTLASGVGTAQQRDAAPPPTTGTSSITGTVVVDEPNGPPLRRATISASLRTGGIFTQYQTTTDDKGQFVLGNLPAGTYSPPTAAKGGFVSTSYGEKRPQGVGTPITLAEGQRLTIALKMLRGAVITGTLQDNGRPVAQVSVSAAQVRVVNGVRTNVGFRGPGSQTDDRGIYRIWGLAPGDYVVSAAVRFGPQGEMRTISDAEMQWADRQLQPGAGAVSATTPGAVVAPPPSQTVAPAPVFYPGTTDSSSAALVTVAAGQERTGVDFSVSYVPTAKVEGTVLDANGNPAATAQLNMVPMVDPNVVGGDPFMMMDSMLMNRPMVNAGRFSIPGVRPGRYTLAVRGPASGASAAAAGAGRSSGPAPMSYWANGEVTVDGRDVSGIELRLQPGMALSGKLVFEATTLKPPADLSRVMIRLSPAPIAGISIAVNVPAAEIAEDGTFKLEGASPGRYLISASVPGGQPGGATWLMKSAQVGGAEAADSGFEVRPNQSVTDIVLTFTDRPSEVSGTLMDATGKPSSALSIMLFSTDKATWSNRSRWLRPPARAGVDGKFRFTNLLPGEYFLAALSDFEQADVFKPDFLEQVAAAAMKIVVAEGEKKVQDIKIAGGG